MDFLKDVFGDKALTYSELETALKDNKDIKVGNLAGGSYVSSDKFKGLETERDGLKTQLSEANTTIQSFKDMDIEGMKKASEDWKTKYDTDTAALQKQLADKDYASSVERIVAGEKFTSEAARKAFIADLKAKELKVDGDTLLGYADFKKAYAEADPNAFASDKKQPTITAPGNPAPSQTSDKEYMDEFYKNNPFYKKS